MRVKHILRPHPLPLCAFIWPPECIWVCYNFLIHSWNLNLDTEPKMLLVLSCELYLVANVYMSPNRLLFPWGQGICIPQSACYSIFSHIWNSVHVCQREKRVIDQNFILELESVSAKPLQVFWSGITGCLPQAGTSGKGPRPCPRACL